MGAKPSSRVCFGDRDLLKHRAGVKPSSSTQIQNYRSIWRMLPWDRGWLFSFYMIATWKRMFSSWAVGSNQLIRMQPWRSHSLSFHLGRLPLSSGAVRHGFEPLHRMSVENWPVWNTYLELERNDSRLDDRTESVNGSVPEWKTLRPPARL